MSDRLAVFDNGKIVQVGAPRRGLRAPCDRIRRGLRGRPRTCWSATAAGSPVRPEKIRILDDGERPAGEHVEAGTIADVSYAGMITRYGRRTRRGWRASGRPPEPRDVPQRTHSRERGRKVHVAWRPQTDVRDRGRSPGSGGSMNTKGLWAAVVACIAAFGLAACGSSSDSGGGASKGSGLNPPKLPVQKTRRPRVRGQLNIIAWAGYAEDGSTDPKVDWGHPRSRRRPAARRTSRSANTSGRDGDADAHRPLRRRVRLG